MAIPLKKMVTSNSDVFRLAHAVFNGLRSRAELVLRSLLATLGGLMLCACESSTSAGASTGDSNNTKEKSVLLVNIDIEQSDGAILLNAELKNSGDQEIRFLPWGSPFEGAVIADYLRIREIGGSEDVPYIGIMVKRRPPSAEDYATVKPGGSLNESVDISKSYDFCANTEYQIAYSGSLASPNGDIYSIKSNTIIVFVSDDFKLCP